jgi:hypothetical protein
MKERVQGCVTAGVALVGAGVVAAIPMAQQAPDVVKSASPAVNIAAYTQSVPELFALSAERTVTGFVGLPVGLANAAIALAQGTPAGNQAAYAILKEIVGGPQWAADPAIYALDDIFPAPIGGDAANEPTQPDPDSAISQFRADVLIAARDDINEAIRDSLVIGPASQPAGNEVSLAYASTRLAGGLAVSGLRAAQSAVSAPLGLVAVAQGLQHSFETGDNTALYTALEAYIDGPSYVLDPVVFAVDDVLPAPVGGDQSTTPNNMSGSEVSKFRANTLLGARDQVRGAVKSLLGVNTNNSAARTLANVDAADTSAKKGPVSRVLSSLNTNSGNASTTSTVGKHRAPALGGLSNLFKKKDDKKADAAPASESGSAGSGSTD